MLPSPPSRHVVRRFSLTRLVTGLAGVAVAVGILVVVLGPGHGHVSIDGLLAMLAGGVGGAVGLSVALRPVADHCARCNRRLEPNGVRLEATRLVEATAALRHGDVETAARLAGQPVPEGTWVSVWTCPGCRQTAVWQAGGSRIVVGEGASLVAALPRR